MVYCRGLVIVSIEQASDTPKNGTLTLASGPSLRRRSHNTAGEAAERQRLQPNFAGSAECGEEEAFTAEESGFDFPDVLDVEID